MPINVAEALSVNGFFSQNSFPNGTALLINYEEDTRKINNQINQPGYKGTKCP